MKTLKFEDAFAAMKEGAKIRLIDWENEVFISIQKPDLNSKMTAPYMYVTSKYGLVPWMPTQIEIMSDKWVVIKR